MIAHTAGIEQNEVGFLLGFRFRIPHIDEFAFDRFAVADIHLTAERFDKKREIAIPVFKIHFLCDPPLLVQFRLRNITIPFHTFISPYKIILLYIEFTKETRTVFRQWKVLPFIVFVVLANSNDSNQKGGENYMARNGALVPESKNKLQSFKSEVASSLNIDLKQGYNGDLSSRDAGSIGGEMVKRMIAYAEKNLH